MRIFGTNTYYPLLLGPWGVYYSDGGDSNNNTESLSVKDGGIKTGTNNYFMHFDASRDWTGWKTTILLKCGIIPKVEVMICLLKKYM